MIIRICTFLQVMVSVSCLTLKMVAFNRNDIITVIGASGNVGKLVSGRLSALGKYKVRGLCRDISKGQTLIGDNKVQMFTGDTKDISSLYTALKGASAVVVCSGTTAFPTKAWDGGNTPNAVDDIGVKNILEAWKSVSSNRKRLLLMSSILVTRRTQFPGVFLNGMRFFGGEGVLDAKAAGEEAVRQAAGEGGFEYSIVRPGQLSGGPYSNTFFLRSLFELDKGAGQGGVQLARGDFLGGGTLRSTLAEVITQTMDLPSWNEGLCDFTVLNVKGAPPSTTELQSSLTNL